MSMVAGENRIGGNQSSFRFWGMIGRFQVSKIEELVPIVPT